MSDGPSINDKLPEPKFPNNQNCYGYLNAIWGEENPRSFINTIPGEVRKTVREIRDQYPEYFDTRDETTVLGAIKKNKKRISLADRRVRLAFWLEYSTAQESNRKMDFSRVFSGLYSPDDFYRLYVTTPHRLAWMLVPPTDYIVKLEEMLDYGIDRMREILDLPLLNSKGQPNTKLIEAQLKIIMMVDQRLKGAVTQRLETKSVNVNVSTKAALPTSMEDIEEKLKELEEREQLLLAPQMVEVVNEG